MGTQFAPENSNRKAIVICPICNDQKTYEIPEYFFQQKNNKDLLRIQVRGGCDHEFIIFVDQMGEIRSVEQFDFRLQFTSRLEESQAGSPLFLENLLESIGEFAVLNFFHAFLFSYNIYVILPSGNSTFVDQLNALFFRFFPAELPIIPAKSIAQKRFAKLNLNKNNELIIDAEGRVFKCPWRDAEKFHLEDDIVRKMLEILDVDSQIVLVRAEIAKFKDATDKMLSFLSNATSIIYETDLRKQMERLLHEKISDNLLGQYILLTKRRYYDRVFLLNRIHIRSYDNLEAIY